MVTYEVFMGLSIMGLVILTGSFNMSEIVRAQEDLWFFIPQVLGFGVFLIAGIAEAHRAPFDLPEAEHELVAGFHTEYSGMKFALVMVGEYLSVILTGSFNMSEIVRAQEDLWFVIPQVLGFVVFLIAGIAETNRAPFDLPEAEHELVAGFHTEYSGMKFAFVMVGEYLGVILTSAIIVTLFFGGWLGPDFLPPIVWFSLKTGLFICFFVLLRAAIPRPRYDQLMSLGWKILLPITLVNLLITGAVALFLRG